MIKYCRICGKKLDENNNMIILATETTKEDFDDKFEFIYNYINNN